MDVLQRILELRQKREWSEYRLSEESQIPQSTISSWYRNNSMPTIPLLEKICAAFNITMSQFFAIGEYTVTLTPEQSQMIAEWSRLDKEKQEKLLEFLKTL